MIRTIVITILIVCTGVLFSQEIVDPAKLWSNMEEHCQPWGSTYSTDFIRFDIDTIIDNLLCQRVDDELVYQNGSSYLQKFIAY